MNNTRIMDLDLSAYKVLAVDDLRLNIVLAKKMLSRYSFTTVTATGGRDAMAAIDRERPVLLLLDLMMPVVDGYDVIKKVRSDKSMAGVRIVVLSALNTNENVVRALNMGADEFIIKPLTLEKLYNCVDAQFEIILAMEADSKE